MDRLYGGWCEDDCDPGMSRRVRAKVTRTRISGDGVEAEIIDTQETWRDALGGITSESTSHPLRLTCGHFATSTANVGGQCHLCGGVVCPNCIKTCERCGLVTCLVHSRVVRAQEEGRPDLRVCAACLQEAEEAVRLERTRSLLLAPFRALANFLFEPPGDEEGG